MPGTIDELKGRYSNKRASIKYKQTGLQADLRKYQKERDSLRKIITNSKQQLDFNIARDGENNPKKFFSHFRVVIKGKIKLGH